MKLRWCICSSSYTILRVRLLILSVLLQVCGRGQSLSVWNLPARECISRAKTRASVQDVLFDENQVSSCISTFSSLWSMFGPLALLIFSFTQILAVGSEPLLTRMNMNGDILSQIQCAPQSAFSVSLHPSGVSSLVIQLTIFSVLTFCLRLQCHESKIY